MGAYFRGAPGTGAESRVWMRPRAEALSGDSLGDQPSLGDGGETG